MPRTAHILTVCRLLRRQRADARKMETQIRALQAKREKLMQKLCKTRDRLCALESARDVENAGA